MNGHLQAHLSNLMLYAERERAVKFTVVKYKDAIYQVAFQHQQSYSSKITPQADLRLQTCK